MQPVLVDLGVLYSAAAEAYFTNADRRILSGLRATLDMLSIPHPPYASRSPTRPLPGKAVAAMFDADNPKHQSLSLAPRRENASADRVAAAQTKRFAR